MGYTKDNITIKKSDFSMTLYVIKGKNENTMFYFKDNKYAPEGSSPPDSNRNLPEEKEVQVDKGKKKIDTRSYAYRKRLT